MRRRLATLLVLTLLGTAFVPGALAKSRLTDRVWTRPDAAQFPLRRIAMLPVVSLEPVQTQAVEEQFLLHFISDGHDWVPPDICLDFMIALARHKPDSVAGAIRSQVLNTSQPDPSRVPFLARVLHSQALLTLRVDRWERTSMADPFTTTCEIVLTAALVDSTGRLLWKATGEERQLAKYGLPRLAGNLSFNQGGRSSGGAGPAGVKVSGGAVSQSGVLLQAPTVTIESPPVTNLFTEPKIVQPGGVGAENSSGTEFAPDFRAALTRLLQRWEAEYPYRPASAQRATPSKP